MEEKKNLKTIVKNTGEKIERKKERKKEVSKKKRRKG